MKLMLIHIIVMLLVIAYASAQPIIQQQKTIAGTFKIFGGDKHIQTDRYELVVGEKSRDDITALDGKQEQQFEVSYDLNGAQHFQSKVNGLSKLRATVDGTFISFYEGETMVGALPAEKNVLMMEPNAYAEFAFLLNAYDVKKGGDNKCRWSFPHNRILWISILSGMDGIT